MIKICHLTDVCIYYTYIHTFIGIRIYIYTYVKGLILAFYLYYIMPCNTERKESQS